MTNSVNVRRMVISAMFLAIALVVRTYFRTYIPIFGESGMRLSIHVVFSAMPAILFGPVYGAIVEGLTDFLGFHLSPVGGAWMPQITAASALGGFIRGGLWMVLRGKSTHVMRSCVAVFSVFLLGFGAYNMAAFSGDGIDRAFYEAYTLELSENEQGQTVRNIADERINTAEMSSVSRMAIVRSINMRDPAEGLAEFMMFVTTAMIGSGIFGGLLLLVDWAAGKFLLKERTTGTTSTIHTMSLLLTMVATAAMVSTLNTISLRMVLPAWQLLPFSVVWLPRIIQAVATATLMSYFIAIMLSICEKQAHLRQWLK